VDKVFESEECDHVIEGTCKMGGQEHFYLEPHGSIVVPLENDEIKIIASTQVADLFWMMLSLHCGPSQNEGTRSLPQHW